MNAAGLLEDVSLFALSAEIFAEQREDYVPTRILDTAQASSGSRCGPLPVPYCIPHVRLIYWPEREREYGARKEM